MRVLVNATSARLGGGLTVLRALLPALAEAGGGRHELLVACRAEVAPALAPLPGCVRLLSRPGPASLAGRAWWEQAVLPLQAARWQADVTLGLAGAPLLLGPGPQVVLFQSAAPFDDDVVARGGSAQARRFLRLRRLAWLAARRARRLVFLAEHTRALALPTLGAAARAAAVLPLGRDPAFRPHAAEACQATRRAHGLAGPYWLTVADHYFYKNLPELVIGFGRALPGLPPGATLAVAGAPHEPDVTAAVERAVAREGLAERVRLLGPLPHRDLPPLYAGAAEVVLPSSCESFPNALVEALASGVPVSIAEGGAMRELAGPAALAFDPLDPDAIAAALLRSWADPAGRADRARLGLERAARLSWPATARRLLALLEEVA